MCMSFYALHCTFKMNGNMDSISRDRDGMVQAGEWNKNKDLECQIGQ